MIGLLGENKMKTKSFMQILSFFAVLVMFPPTGFAGYQGSAANAKIAGINKLWIDIKPDSDTDEFPEIEQLRNQCSEKLRKAGIDVCDTSKSSDFQVPNLMIHFNILDINSSSCVYYVQTSLSRYVFLRDEKSGVGFNTQVWESKSEMEFVSKENLTQSLTDAAGRQIDSFINEWSRTKASQGYPNSAVAVKAPDDKKSKTSEKQTSEQKLVASKNGKVFHKPDCRFVARISEENLVSYANIDRKSVV
jgi:hypothetical protein